MKALHVQLQAFSATYPYPFLKSGTQLTLPVPPFSSILGNLSACAGRPVGPEETLIGVEFRTEGQSIDLERTRRLGMDSKSGRLSQNPVRGLAYREFHVRPRLDLYLSETAFKACFDSPAAAPCLGRSQDLAWICFVHEIELVPVDGGRLGPTLLPFPNMQVGGRILPPLADYFVNTRLGFTRTIGRLSRYQFVPDGARVGSMDGFQIFRASDRDVPARWLEQDA